MRMEAAQVQKRIPMRQCTGCREMKPKREMIRVVRSPEGSVSLDFKGKAPGRGAYICPDEACLKKALKSRALEHALEVSIPEAILDELRGQGEGTHG